MTVEELVEMLLEMPAKAEVFVNTEDGAERMVNVEDDGGTVFLCGSSAA